MSNKQEQTRSMTHLSLFSGIGGIDIAAEWAGFATTATCEIDEGCRKVLAKHFPEATHFKDIRDVTKETLTAFGIDSPTLISAGFPCQPFSVAGKRNGTDDERHLWPEVARVLSEVGPRWFLGENVRGLLSISGGRVFGSVLADLAHLGYRVGWGCYGADEACGSHHRRDRVFIVGYLAHPNIGGWGTVGEVPRQVPTNGRCELADTESMGRTEGMDVAVRVVEEQPGPENKSEPVGNATFPPGPKDFDAWARILRDRPDLAPALTAEEEAELSVRPVADGISRRMALKMLGNAIVPQQIYPILQAIADHEKCNRTAELHVRKAGEQNK